MMALVFYGRKTFYQYWQIILKIIVKNNIQSMLF